MADGFGAGETGSAKIDGFRARVIASSRENRAREPRKRCFSRLFLCPWKILDLLRAREKMESRRKKIMETGIEKILTVDELLMIKYRLDATIDAIQQGKEDLHAELEKVEGYVPHEYYTSHSTKSDKKEAEKYLWLYLLRAYRVEQYILSDEFNEVQKSVYDKEAPDFTEANVRGWIDGLAERMYSGAVALIKKVYADLVNGTYHVGGWNGEKKKRNNNGIDSNFILSAYDYSSLYGYHISKPTITDDLEKACYLLDGKRLPDQRLKETMRLANATTGKNEYMEITVHKNNNTHYKLTEEARARLNKYGPEGNEIGEAVKIKILGKGWRT
jgi:hypothetical protein